jgi:hypothetical protein
MRKNEHFVPIISKKDGISDAETRTTLSGMETMVDHLGGTH